jgi:hypothetical protein
MALVSDEGTVQELAATSADPAFGDRVHAGRLDVAEHGPNPGVSDNRVPSHNQRCGGRSTRG